MKEYDESEAIKFIRSQVDGKNVKNYADDDILLIIDAIFDFFEESGEDDDFELNENELILYVKNQLRKDIDNVVDMDDVKDIVKAELNYEEMLQDEE